MGAWSKRFRAYVVEKELTCKQAALAFTATPSQVHYWMHGSVPRLKKREEILRITKGAVTLDGRPPVRAKRAA